MCPHLRTTAFHGYTAQSTDLRAGRWTSHPNTLMGICNAPCDWGLYNAFLLWNISVAFLVHYFVSLVRFQTIELFATPYNRISAVGHSFNDSRCWLGSSSDPPLVLHSNAGASCARLREVSWQLPRQRRLGLDQDLAEFVA